MKSFRRIVSLSGRAAKNFFVRRPLCVSFEITYSCNARCQHCHLGGPAKEERASPEAYAKIAEELRPVTAQISGGEPMLRRDLVQIIKAIRKPSGPPFIVLTTNAALLTKEKYFNLREAGVDEFSISFDYPDERHDEFRGIPGLFRRIESLLQELQSFEDKRITLSCVVQSKNYRELIRIAQLAKEWNTAINFSTYTWLRTHQKEFLIPKNELSEFKEIIEEILTFKRKHRNVYTSDYTLRNMVHFFENHSIPNCRAGERFFVVNPDGTLSPCGLILRNYQSRKQLRQDFTKNNACTLCFTSIRANTEKPLKYLIKDSLQSI